MEPVEPVEPGPVEPGPPADDARRLSPAASAFLGLGLSVAVCMAVAVGLGVVIDALAHTGPVFLLVGIVAGLGLSVAFFVATVRKYL